MAIKEVMAGRAYCVETTESDGHNFIKFMNVSLAVFIYNFPCMRYSLGVHPATFLNSLLR